MKKIICTVLSLMLIASVIIAPAMAEARAKAQEVLDKINSGEISQWSEATPVRGQIDSIYLLPL